MERDLDSMNSEELGKLFPILIMEPDPVWPRLYKTEEKKIRAALGKDIIINIDHIGSTAIPGMPAKPTIDILIQVTEDTANDHLIESLEKIGYHYIPKPENPPPHMMFVKGYTPGGIRGQTYHAHLRHKGIHDEIIFRDYLVVHPDVAMEYARLKYRLAETYRNDRDGYTEAKTEFVKRIIGNP